MGDTLITIVAIALAAILMFVSDILKNPNARTYFFMRKRFESCRESQRQPATCELSAPSAPIPSVPGRTTPPAQSFSVQSYAIYGHPSGAS